MRFLSILLLCLLIGGCDKDAIMQKMAPPELQAEAKAHIAKLRSRDFKAVEAALDESVAANDITATLAKMADLIPPGQPDSVKLVGVETSMVPGDQTVRQVYEYQFGQRWLIIAVALKEHNGVRTIAAMDVLPQVASLDEQHAFRLSGKSPVQYAVLAGAVAAVLVTLVALVSCIRTKLPRGKKAGWIIFILLGVGRFAVNWTTGEFMFTPVAVNIFSAGAVAVTGPWIISAAIPLGALLFLFRGPKRREAIAYIQ